MLQYPKDANGIWVSLDTTAMYRKNGNQFHVSDFLYEAKADKWYARSGGNCVAVDNLYLGIEVETDTSDSWEKLEADLKRIVDYKNSRMFGSPICAYAGMQDSGFCDGCKFIEDEYCEIAMCDDILNRIRNLRGETHDC